MPIYLDVHGLGNMTEEQIKQAQNAPKDEFGVTDKNMLYNIEENRFYCKLKMWVLPPDFPSILCKTWYKP
jgi:hypothetical protein